MSHFPKPVPPSEPRMPGGRRWWNRPRLAYSAIGWILAIVVMVIGDYRLKQRLPTLVEIGGYMFVALILSPVFGLMLWLVGRQLSPLHLALEFDAPRTELPDMTLPDLARRVNSRKTFAEFLDALRADWEASRAAEAARPSSPDGPQAGGWENPDLGRFLKAMHAWMQDMDDRLPRKPSWRTFADILMAAKMYE